MLVKDLLDHMSSVQVATISIYNSDPKGNLNILFEQKTKTNKDRLSIPNDLLNREVDFYNIDHFVSTRGYNDKGVYGNLPYIELELDFNICILGE